MLKFTVYVGLWVGGIFASTIGCTLAAVILVLAAGFLAVHHHLSHARSPHGLQQQK